jgi:hypothetical protein
MNQRDPDLNPKRKSLKPKHLTIGHLTQTKLHPKHIFLSSLCTKLFRSALSNLSEIL